MSLNVVVMQLARTGADCTQISLTLSDKSRLEWVECR